MSDGSGETAARGGTWALDPWLGPPPAAWATDAEALLACLRTDRVHGLSSADAEARLRRIGPNRLEPEVPVPAWRKLLAQFADPLVYLLIAALAVSLLAWVLEGTQGFPFEPVVITVILLANAVLGYVQEARAERAVAALERMAATTAAVVRDGVERRIPADEVVPGDVLVLGEGDAVGADGRLLEASALTVSEASLTGESEPVVKDTGLLPPAVALGDRTNMVFAGTAVTRGRGRAIVTGTGMTTEIGRIAELLETTEQERTPLQREIDHVGRVLGVAVLLVAAIVVVAVALTSEIRDASDVINVLIVGVALAVAAVPEGLPAVLSVVLALGVQRMARRNAIVKELSSVETLGSASVICSDKTGTLTRNEMTIRRIVTRSGAVEVTGSGYRPEGEFLTEDGPPVGSLAAEGRVVLAGGSLAGNASLREEDGSWVVHGDPTDAAFLVAEHKAGLVGERDGRFTRVGEVPFTSERKLMSTLQADADRGGGLTVVTKGAPDVLLARCTHEQAGDEHVPLDAARRRAILSGTEELAGEALRTLGVAYRPLEADAPTPADEELERELIFAGLVGIMDPPRPEAARAIAVARRAGIRVVMITGDHPATAARIAAELGIDGEEGSVVTGARIEELDDAELRSVVRDTSVYARVVPEHKLRIVDALRADGHIVAMTGDGVNDAPALKRADIGIAMGVTGTDVAKEAADMVLADDDFATIVAAVREGRGIFANIRTFLRYLLSSNAGEVLTMLFGVMGAGLIGLDAVGGAVNVPLLATQILWINLLTDSAPALALGVDPPPDDVMERAPRRLTDRVIDARMQRGVVFVGLVMAVATLLTFDLAMSGGLFEGSGEPVEARTMAFTTLVLAQLFNCMNARSDRASAFRRPLRNRLLLLAIALSLLLQVAVVSAPFLNRAFDTTPLDPERWLVCAGMASTVLWAVELRKLILRGRARRTVDM